MLNIVHVLVDCWEMLYETEIQTHFTTFLSFTCSPKTKQPRSFVNIDRGVKGLLETGFLENELFVCPGKFLLLFVENITIERSHKKID